MARRLVAVLGGDRSYHNTKFGPANVAMHVVGVAVKLANGQQALDRCCIELYRGIEGLFFTRRRFPMRA